MNGRRCPRRNQEASSLGGACQSRVVIMQGRSFVVVVDGFVVLETGDEGEARQFSAGWQGDSPRLFASVPHLSPRLSPRRDAERQFPIDSSDFRLGDSRR
jgi:hypothetical protein